MERTLDMSTMASHGCESLEFCSLSHGDLANKGAPMVQLMMMTVRYIYIYTYTYIMLYIYNIYYWLVVSAPLKKYEIVRLDHHPSYWGK